MHVDGHDGVMGHLTEVTIAIMTKFKKYMSGGFFDLKRTSRDLDIRHVKCASGPTRGSSRKHF